MRIINKLAILNIIKNKKKTITTIISFSLSMMLLTVLIIGVNSFRNDYIQYSKDTKRYYHAKIEGFDEKKYQELFNNEEVTNIVSEYYLGTYIRDTENFSAITSTDQSNSEKLGMKIVNGHFPTNNNEIMITSYIMATYNLPLNSYLEGNIESYTIDEKNVTYIKHVTKKKYKVVGVYTDNSRYDFSKIVTTKEKSDRVNVYMTFKHPKDSETTLAKIYGFNTYAELEQYYSDMNDRHTFNDKQIAYELNSDLISVESFPNIGIDYKSSVGGLVSLGPVSANYILIILGIISFTIFCLSNVFKSTYSINLKTYGLLKSVGLTNKQVKKIVFRESIYLSIISITIGIISGILLTSLLINIINNLYTTYQITPSIYYFDLYPLMNTVPLLTGFKLNLSYDSTLIITLISLGAIISLLSIVFANNQIDKLLVIDEIKNDQKIKAATNGILGNFVEKRGKNTTKIAYKNMRRSKNKYRGITFILTFILSVSIIFSYIISQANSNTNDTYSYKKYDFVYWHSYRNYDNSYIDKVKNMDSIKDISYQYSLKNGEVVTKELDKVDGYSIPECGDNKTESCPGRYYNFETYALDKQSFDKYARSMDIDPTTLKDKVILVEGDRSYESINIGVYLPNRYEKDDVIKVDYLGKSIDITVGGIAKKMPDQVISTHSYLKFYGNIMIVPLENEVFDFKLDSILFNTTNYDKTISQLKTIGNNDLSFIEDNVAIKNNELVVYKINDLIVNTCIVSVGIVVSMIVFNFISSNMIQRKREFAIYKSIGMTTKQINQVITREIAFTIFKSLVYSLVIAFIVSFILYSQSGYGLNFKFIMPYDIILKIILIVIIFVLLISKYCSIKINKEDSSIIDEIRNEKI